MALHFPHGNEATVRSVRGDSGGLPTTRPPLASGSAEAARHKHREVLKVARPGSAAARRAQGGLAN